MITYLLFHLWDQEDQRCPSLLAYPEDLEDPRHLKHRWDQGYPSVTSIKVNTSWPKLLQTCELYIDYGVKQYLWPIWTRCTRNSFRSLQTCWTQFSSLPRNSTLSLEKTNMTSWVSDSQTPAWTGWNQCSSPTLGPIWPTGPSSPGIPWKKKATFLMLSPKETWNLNSSKTFCNNNLVLDITQGYLGWL